MDGYKHEGLSDEALERDIEAALGVDPSPEFLPRVRARIASERVHDGWLWSASRRWAGAVAVVTAVAIMGVWTLRDPSPAPREARLRDSGFGARGAGLESRDPELGTAAATLEPSVSSAPNPGPVVRHVRAESRLAVAVTAPEVVVSNDEAVALRRLVVAIANQQVKAVDIPELGVESVPLPALEEIVLEPIKLSPLAGLEGE